MAEKETVNVYSVDGKKITKDDQEDQVNSHHPKYTEWMEISELGRTLMQGERAMKDAGENYLPKFELESDGRYNTRLARSSLRNAFRKTITFLAGQVFQGEISFTDEFPDEIKDAMGDVDLLNSTLSVFSRRVFEGGLGSGVGHIMVEAPSETAATRQDERAQGIRPYFKDIRGENVIGWRTDDADELVQIRIVEPHVEDFGTYGQKFTHQIRTLYPGGWEIHRQTTDGGKDYILVEDGVTSLDYIPLVTYLPGEPLSLLTGESPLQDLADMNLDHWQEYSDLKNLLHTASVPILFGRGIDLSQFIIGSSKAITSDTEEADLKFVEITGASIKTAQANIKEIEEAMALYGLQQLVNRTGGVTATERAISKAESNSSLATWVNGYEDALSQALGIWGDYQGVEIPPDSVIMPIEFTTATAEAAMVQAYLKAVDSKVLSRKAAFEYLNSTGSLGDAYTWDVIEEEIESDRRQAGPTDLAGIFGGLGQPDQGGEDEDENADQ